MAKGDKAAGLPSKTALVKEAMEALGGNPGPNEIIEYVKSNHKTELDYSLVASYKSNILKKEGQSTGSKRGRKPGSGSGGGTVDINDLLAVRELLNRLGKDQLHKLITVVAD